MTCWRKRLTCHGSGRQKAHPPLRVLDQLPDFRERSAPSISPREELAAEGAERPGGADRGGRRADAEAAAVEYDWLAEIAPRAAVIKAPSKSKSRRSTSRSPSGPPRGRATLICNIRRTRGRRAIFKSSPGNRPGLPSSSSSSGGDAGSDRPERVADLRATPIASPSTQTPRCSKIATPPRTEKTAPGPSHPTWPGAPTA